MVNPASPAKRFYKSARWQMTRQHQLQMHPLCAYCLKQNRITLACVVDHVFPHRGNYDLFWYGSLQSLCFTCHNSLKKQQEEKGFSNHIGSDGWPTDPNHPSNCGKIPRKRDYGFGIPFGLQPSGIPVTLVCGPPAAGKSTWVMRKKLPEDTVISLDECKLHVGGKMWDRNPTIWKKAMKYRD